MKRINYKEMKKSPVIRKKNIILSMPVKLHPESSVQYYF